jgi:hypothetical protein
MAIAMQNNGIDMVVPFYYFTGDSSYQCLVPYYKDIVPTLNKPDGAIILGKMHGKWRVETVIDMKSALNNALVLNKYVSTPWLSIDRAAEYKRVTV